MTFSRQGEEMKKSVGSRGGGVVAAPTSGTHCDVATPDEVQPVSREGARAVPALAATLQHR